MIKKEEALKDKKVIIIGGSAGIGLATAQAAAAKGAKVIICSSSRSRIDKALALLPDGTEGHTLDVNDEVQVKRFFETTGSFDHLVFTAGENLQLGDIKDTALETARRFFDIRYWGAFTAVKYASQHIRTNGSIVLTGGIAGKRPQKGWSLGASICNAMEGFTRAMAVELAPVRVNCVSPGIVKTGLWSGMPVEARENMYQQVGKALPVQHAGEALEVATTYVYLMEQTYSTGQTVVVDGGGSLI